MKDFCPPQLSFRFISITTFLGIESSSSLFCLLMTSVEAVWKKHTPDSLGSFLKVVIDFNIHATVIKIARPNREWEERLFIWVLTYPSWWNRGVYLEQQPERHCSITAALLRKQAYQLLSGKLLTSLFNSSLDQGYSSFSLRSPLGFVLGWEWSAGGWASPSCGKASLWP